MQPLTVAALLLLVSAYVAAEVVSFQSCNTGTADEDTEPIPSNCTVHEVRITPCPEAAEDEPCKLKRAKNAKIEFEFTPDVVATDLKHKAYWTSALADLPLAGMDLDACSYATCPTTPGQRQTYSYQLHISRKFPTRQYDVKWRLYQDSVMDCCFIYRIKLLK